MTVLVVGGRLLVRWTLDRIVLFRDRELFTLCVGFFGLGAAVVTSSVCFSIAIGAFIAGMIISESEYGLQALSDVLPFRSLFSGIFFTSIGMLLDIPIVRSSSRAVCHGRASVCPQSGDLFLPRSWPWVACSPPKSSAD